MKKWIIRNIVCVFFLGIAFLLCSDVSKSLGQTSEGKPMLADGYSDYFLKNRNQLAYKNVKNVNRFHLKPAIRLIRSGKPQRAIPDLEFVLRWVPNHPMGLMLIANVSRLAQRPNLAVARFEQAIHLFPKYGMTYAQYGKFLYDLKKNKKAIDLLNKAIALDSKLGVAYGWLSLAYYAEGKKGLAKKEEKKARALGYKGPFRKG